MFDQFQQAMGMLVQMFGTMHREQMDVIREELDRLHDLTRELRDLKEELARAPARTAAPAVAPASSSTPASDPGRVPNAGAAAGAPPASATGARARLDSAAIPPPPPPSGRRPDQVRPGGVAMPGATGDPEAADVPRDAVAWIHQRIAAIQQERESRWQKIVKLLPGMS
jgi:hypothetical protein